MGWRGYESAGFGDTPPDAFDTLHEPKDKKPLNLLWIQRLIILFWRRHDPSRLNAPPFGEILETLIHIWLPGEICSWVFT